MDMIAMVYTLGVLAAGAMVVAGIVEGSRWLVARWHGWETRRYVRREIQRAARAQEEERLRWQRSWGGDY